jgi:multiple inositol-polyphosphate phosphatase/2,3-bisphosphoglycerate 3-phosphatase
MCRFDQAWHLQDYSPWCVAFTKDQVKILEYLEDLQYYYENGYGTQANDMIACHAVNDMLMHLESKGNPNVVSYFTHESEIQLFLVALGAAKDTEALRADNYYSMARRQFRSSTLTPFTSNVAAIKYECKDERDPDKVMFFLNEKPLLFDWCNVGLCNLHDVLERYRNFKYADCSKEFCKRNFGTNILPSMTILLSLLLARMIF